MLKGLVLKLLTVCTTLVINTIAEEKSVTDGASVIDNGMYTLYYPEDSLISNAFAAFSHNVINRATQEYIIELQDEVIAKTVFLSKYVTSNTSIDVRLGESHFLVGDTSDTSSMNAVSDLFFEGGFINLQSYP